MPRVRLFLWKLIHNGLPLGEVMSKRLRSGSGECPNWGSVVEDVRHMTMWCPFARLCWFASEMAIRVEGFQNVQQLMEFMIQHASGQQWDLMANCLWGIWRCRNNMAYAGVRPNYKDFSMFLLNINTETEMAASYKQNVKGQRAQVQDEVQSKFVCYSDGSWLNHWNGGAGYMVFQGEVMVTYGSARTEVSGPYQAEAWALREAIWAALRLGIESCTFYSDNETLVTTCTSIGPPIEAEWLAYKEVFDIWKLIKGNRLYQCAYISRENNSMADHLAKKGRIQGWNCQGSTYPIFLDTRRPA